jgi:hypothetical protein
VPAVPARRLPDLIRGPSTWPTGSHADPAPWSDAVTMDIYSEVSSDLTLRALKVLSERLEGH